MSQFVTFTLDDLSFGLPLECVAKVIHAAAYRPLPQGPDIVFGIINLQGSIIPLINLRRRFGLPERDMGLGDHLLVARSARRMLAMSVDSAGGVIECDESTFVPIDSVVTGTRYIRGVVKGATGMIFIHDLDSFLSLDEAQSLDAALAPKEGRDA